VRLSTRLYALALSAAVASPAGAQSTTNDHFVTDMVKALKDPARWSLSGNVAASRTEPYLLQTTQLGERAVRAERGVAWGLGTGFDVGDKLGLRLGWSYTNSNMEFRDFNGTGSDLLDVEDIGKLKTNIASLDVVHYFVGSRSLISPYAGAGVAGVWSGLAPQGDFLATPGGSQQFHWGLDASVGVQVRVIEKLFGRAEWATMGSHNPFNGNRSYRAVNGVNIDEPTRINKTEWRLAATYYFGTPATQPTVTATKAQ
jgi:outer membrane protein W